MVRERVRLTLRFLEDPASGTLDERVRESRKRLKQIRALLRIARADLGRERYQQENATLRDAAQRLAGARDAAALVATWDRTAPQLQELATASDPFRAALLAEVARQEALHLTQEAAFGTVAAAVKRVRTRIDEWPLYTDDPSLLEAAFRRSYGTGYDLWQSARAGTAVLTDYHDWRKRVKDTWYQLRVVAAYAPDEFGPLVVAADALAKELGWVHDLSLLELALAGPLGQESLAPEPRAHLAGRLARIRTRAEAQARELGTELYLWKPKQFAERVERWMGE